MAMIHVSRGATSLGAFPEDEVRAGLRSGRFLPSDLGWREGMANWQPLSQFAEFTAEVGTAPAVPSPPPQQITEVGVAAPVAAARTEPLAIWSLVLSIVSLVCCGIIIGVPGVICGHMALSNIRKNPALEGRGLATAGIIIGYVSIFCWLVYVVFFGGAAFLQAIRENMSR